MGPSSSGERVPTDDDGAIVRPPLTVSEIQRLEEELRPLVEPQVVPGVREANLVVGVADELGRLIASFALGAVVLIAVAVLATPWVWIGVAAWVALAVATVVSLRLRRRRGEVLTLAATPPTPNR